MNKRAKCTVFFYLLKDFNVLLLLKHYNVMAYLNKILSYMKQKLRVINAFMNLNE